MVTNRRAAAILLAWWALLGIGNAVWLARDTLPPAWDSSVHLLSSLRYARIAREFLHGSLPLADAGARLLGVDAFYPPFAPFASAVATLALPADPDISTWALNQIFLALLIWGTYRLGRRFGNPVAGIAAAVAVTSFGGVWQATHVFMLDLPLAAVTALAFEALFATEGFTKTGRSAWFGLIGAVGMLTKWTFLFFMIVPALTELFRPAHGAGSLRRARNALLALTIGGLCCAPWYYAHAPNLAQDLVGFGYRVGWEPFPEVASWQGAAFYPRAFASLLLAPWLCVLLVATPLALWRDARLRHFALLSISGLVFLALLKSKAERYAMPVLPAVAVVASSWAGRPRWSGRVRAVAIGALAVASLAIALERDPPVRQHWPIEEALAAALARPHVSPPCVRVIPDLPAFQRFAFEYAAELKGLNVDIEGFSGFPSFTDSVIMKTGYQGTRPESVEIMAEVAKDAGGFHEIYRKVWSHPLPDGSRADLYGRDIQPVPGIAPAALVEKLRDAVRAEVARQIQAPFSGKIDVETASDGETLRGYFRRVAISAENLRVGEGESGRLPLVVRELRCELSGVTVNPYRLRDGELELLSLEELVPHLLLREEDVNVWLGGQREVSAQVAFRDGVLRATMRRPRWPAIEITAVLEIVAGSNIGVRFRQLRVAGFPLPTFLLSLPASAYNPILKQMPCRIRLAELRCENGTLLIGGN